MFFRTRKEKLKKQLNKRLSKSTKDLNGFKEARSFLLQSKESLDKNIRLTGADKRIQLDMINERISTIDNNILNLEKEIKKLKGRLKELNIPSHA